MPNYSEVLRAHTVPGLNGVNLIPQVTFRGWIGKKRFNISSAFASKKFLLDVYSHDEILIPLAFDINRMATSSFESINGITPENRLPKSFGWLIIRAYYSAYFAAHSILRLFGISCSQFDRNEARSVTDVAKVHMQQNGITASTGYYKCSYDYTNKKIDCSQLGNTHQDVWKALYELLNELSSKVASSDFLKKDRDETIEFLFQLRHGLSHRGKINTGSWLSKVRNDVNYSHTMGAWYPYNNSVNNIHLKMFRGLSSWKEDPSPEGITAASQENDHMLFLRTCTSLVSLCRSLLIDLNSVSSNSFLKNGPIRFINQI